MKEKNDVSSPCKHKETPGSLGKGTRFEEIFLWIAASQGDDALATVRAVKVISVDYRLSGYCSGA